jgi:hypothetical protein
MQSTEKRRIHAGAGVENLSQIEMNRGWGISLLDPTGKPKRRKNMG